MPTLTAKESSRRPTASTDSQRLVAFMPTRSTVQRHHNNKAQPIKLSIVVAPEVEDVAPQDGLDGVEQVALLEGVVVTVLEVLEV